MTDDLNGQIRSVEMQRLAGGAREADRDCVVVEEPLEIRIGKVAVAVTMRTPGHDDELAAGFLFTEGVVQPGDVAHVAHCSALEGPSKDNVVVVELAASASVDLDRVKRNFYATSSCGICGKASLEQVCQQTEASAFDGTISVEMLQRLPGVMRDAQRAFAKTGGLHAAALFDTAGRLLCVREDIGRHNAVDKVVGWALLGGELPLDRHVLMVSGRASFEIVQKAAVARIPVVAAVSAPSSLAVELAEQTRMTLVGFLREGAMNVYTWPERVA